MSSTPDCGNPLHTKDKHQFCLVCLSPKHFARSHKHYTCSICKHMSESSCRDRKNCRARILKLNSPGRWSLAQSLISLVTGGFGEGSVPRESSGFSSEESIPGLPRRPSTHSWVAVGVVVVAVAPPPPPHQSPQDHGGSTHTPSLPEECVMDPKRAAQDEYPLG